MRAAYWLAFALALTPPIAIIMGSVFTWGAIVRLTRNNAAEPAAKRDQRPVWFLFLLALFAFALMLWQTLYVGDLFAGYSYDYGVESVEVLGVSIPLELGENIKRFVDSAFSTLLNLWIVVIVVVSFVRARKQPRAKAGVAGWIFGVVLLGLFAFMLWSTWRSLPYQIENFQAIF